MAHNFSTLGRSITILDRLMKMYYDHGLSDYEIGWGYGRDIPLACVGIISKVNVAFNSVVFGISQSTQPIIGFNYGAKNYTRVKETFDLGH